MSEHSPLRIRLLNVATSLHRTIFESTGGRLLGRAAGMPVLMLTTTGRKSGRKIKTMLTSPIQDGDSVVIVASFGGHDRHPAWFLNLRDNPVVEVLMSDRAGPRRARIASREEKAELWPRIVQKYKGYEGYQKSTTRDIPLVILDPTAAPK